MVEFYLESWAAVAPGIEDKAAWLDWFAHPVALDNTLGKPSLKQIPPMLRRRFSDLGKTAAVAAFPLLEQTSAIPCIFASRHGDTHLTFSLLEDVGKKEPMSPTGFSLAVHNAVSGLFSIARKDVSAVTAIAATEGLVASAFIEAAGQLQDSEKVLCIIYDVPLPEFYTAMEPGDAFPYACAMILSRTPSGECLQLTQQSKVEAGIEPSAESDVLPAEFNSESLHLIRMLVGLSDSTLSIAQQTLWCIRRDERSALFPSLSQTDQAS